MAVVAEREGWARANAPRVALVAGFALLAVLLAGCGEAADTTGGHAPVVVEEAGSIGAGDARDPNHADLPYDAYAFEASKRDAVVVEVTAEGFVPLLKLVEVATGAVLAEWEEEHSDEKTLSYTIAGPGVYEARVYALEGGSGAYTLTVRMDP